MAVRLPLPDPAGLPPVVLFHREHPAEPMLVLQVPNPGATEAETYLVRLDLPAHRTWMEGLAESRRLLDLLKMEMHVAFEPSSGAMQPIRDLDTPPPFAEDIAAARREASGAHAMDRRFRLQQRRVPAMSRLRMALLGRPTRST